MRDDMLFFAYPALALLLASSPSHAAQNVSFDNPTHMTSHIHDVGKACNVNRTRLAPDSNQLQGDCGYLAWCDPSTNTCKVNGCRTDEYPFGYNNIDKKVSCLPLCPYSNSSRHCSPSRMHRYGLRDAAVASSAPTNSASAWTRTQ